MAETTEVNATVSISDVLIDNNSETKESGGENGSKPTASSEGQEDGCIVPAETYWTTARDGAVKLRVGTSEHDKSSPITVYEMFKRTVEKTGNSVALAVKRDDQWQKWTYSQYMEDCRTVAKGFIKVCTSFQTRTVCGGG